MKFLLKLLLTLALLAGLVSAYKEPLQDLLDARNVPFEEKLLEAFHTMDDNVVVLGYQLSEADLKEYWNLITNSNGDLFHLANRYEYTFQNGLILSVTPYYTMTPEEYQAALEIYNSEIGKIVSTVDPSWTDLQTALYLHDYIAMHYSYDITTEHNSAFDMLTTGTSVCQGYTQLYGDLLKACGIECTYIISEEMRHTWNVVKLDGAYYHVDVTHDDSIPDRLGKAEHKNFLRSDMALADHSFTPHEGYGLCTDTTYDNSTIWAGVTSGFIPMGDEFYFIQDGCLYKWMGNDTYYIDTIYAKWYTDDSHTSYWKGHYSTLWAADGLLLYSKPDRIMGYDPDTGLFHIVYLYEGPGDIYGMQFIDGVLKLQVGTTPNEAGKIIIAESYTLP